MIKSTRKEIFKRWPTIWAVRVQGRGVLFIRGARIAGAVKWCAVVGGIDRRRMSRRLRSLRLWMLTRKPRLALTLKTTISSTIEYQKNVDHNMLPLPEFPPRWTKIRLCTIPHSAKHKMSTWDRQVSPSVPSLLPANSEDIKCCTYGRDGEHYRQGNPGMALRLFLLPNPERNSQNWTQLCSANYRRSRKDAFFQRSP